MRNLVIESYKKALRFPEDDHGSIFVRISKKREDIGIDIRKSVDCDLCRGSFKGWAAFVYDISIYVPLSWKKTVYDRGLATAGGMLTLSARKVSESNGITVYKAIWERQSRGYSSHYESGYIATDGILFYHAVTKQDAEVAFTNHQEN